ncbi:hypothetical protein Lal_00037895 [Lupinus albus]|nr:hypothetical protein Lal_00037895 [Lupinus albus]
MASSILLFLFLSFFILKTSSQTCTTQKLTVPKTKTLYSNCINLPYLNSYLQYTHNPSNSSLSIAFIASPPSPSGWVSWGLNPTGSGMVGTQAIAAYSEDGKMTIKTLDIQSYKVLVPGKLSYEVWDLSAEESDGVIRIFATLKVKEVGEVNHVWQYTHNPSNSSLSIAFIASPPSPSGWVSWGLNPTGSGMVGTQAIAAYSEDGKMTIKTLDIQSYKVLVPGKLSYEVWDLSAEESDGVIRIFATLKVKEVGEVNHVWQVGPSVSNGRLDIHAFQPGNLNSKGILKFSGGHTSSSTVVDSNTRNKNIHGILNAVSWGVLFPLGVIIARYMRTFPSADPAWFYLHVGCQLSAYAIGVAGWATGLKLGSNSVGITYSLHRNIGISLFALATLQIFALFLRPKKDHKYRHFWNIYHHSIGYTIIILGLLNIFKGFDILNPEKKWKTTYIGVIAALGVIAVLLEVITWIVVLKRKANNSTKTVDGYNNNGQ